MEMERAQARARREVGERRRLFGRRDHFARALDRLDLRIGRAELIGPATLAGAIARPLRFRGGRKERDVLPLRRPRGATRPAIDASRADREDEGAVEGRIAAADRVPARVVARGRPGL